MPEGIAGNGAKVVKVGLANLWILLFKPLLVCDRGLLDELDVDGAAAPLIAVQERLVRIPRDDVMQCIDKLHRVVNAAVQPESSDRIVDVGRVPGQEYPACSNPGGDALVGFIEVAVDDLIWFG